MESLVKLTLSSLELTYWKVALLLVCNFCIELNFEQVIESFYWYFTSTTEQKMSQRLQMFGSTHNTYVAYY
mgnify:CR=1 FL=1